MRARRRCSSAEGAQVALTDVLESGAAVAAELGESAMFICHDVASEEDWHAVVKSTRARFGKIDVLINNAGIFHPKPIGETSVADFDRHYQVNQRGVFLGMKSVLEIMKSAGRGSIVNISSLAGLRGYPDMVAYCGTKWAIRGMSIVCSARAGTFRHPRQFHLPRPSRYPDDQERPF